MMMTLANITSGYALGNWGLAFIGVYVLTLIGIGWLGHRAKKEDTLDDHYLGGRAFGFSVLFLTLYACILYTSPSPRDRQKSRMPSSA